MEEENKPWNPSWEAVQLTPCAWFLEEQERTEKTINHIRSVLGTFQAETCSTYNFLGGYLAGLKTMYRKFEEQPSK